MPRAKQKTPIPSEIAELLRVALGLDDKEVVVAENIIRHEFKKEIEKIIKLSDEIESGGETTFGEWRAFKHFRNTMRDRYLKKKRIGEVSK